MKSVFRIYLTIGEDQQVPYEEFDLAGFTRGLVSYSSDVLYDHVAWNHYIQLDLDPATTCGQLVALKERLAASGFYQCSLYIIE